MFFNIIDFFKCSEDFMSRYFFRYQYFNDLNFLDP